MRALSRAVVIGAVLCAATAPSCAGRGDSHVPRGARVAATYHVTDTELRGITVDEAHGRLWLSAPIDEKLFRVDVAGNDVRWVSWPSGRPFAYTSVDDPYVWMSSWLTNTLQRLDTRDGSISYPSFPPDRQMIMQGPLGNQVLDGVLWVAFHDGAPQGSVAQLDALTGETLRVIPYGPHMGGGPDRMIATDTAVWVAVPGFAEVLRLDRVTGDLVAVIPAGATCGEMAASATRIYVAGADLECGPAGVRSIDIATNRTDDTPLYGGLSAAVAYGFGSVWVHDRVQGVLLRIDPDTRAIQGQLALPDVNVLAVGLGALWAITYDGLLVRLVPDPL